MDEMLWYVLPPCYQDGWFGAAVGETFETYLSAIQKGKPLTWTYDWDELSFQGTRVYTFSCEQNERIIVLEGVTVSEADMDAWPEELREVIRNFLPTFTRLKAWRDAKPI